MWDSWRDQTEERLKLEVTTKTLWAYDANLQKKKKTFEKKHSEQRRNNAEFAYLVGQAQKIFRAQILLARNQKSEEILAETSKNILCDSNSYI